jgi:hypothetical protein
MFYKKVLPLAWFGFLVVFAGVALSRADLGSEERWPFIIMPLFMARLAFVLMRKLVWNLADEERVSDPRFRSRCLRDSRSTRSRLIPSRTI